MEIKIQKLFVTLALLALAALNFQFSTALAQGTTAFTYQGQLRDNGYYANGTYTVTFNLYDSPSGGKLIAGPLTQPLTLVNGLFTVSLDFGPGVFNGNARYLDITVQNGNVTQELSPRMPVQPDPYSLCAATLATNAVVNGDPSFNGNPDFSGDITISNFNVGVGTYVVPPTDPDVGTYPDSLLFSYEGQTQMAIVPSNGVGINGGLYIGGGEDILGEAGNDPGLEIDNGDLDLDNGTIYVAAETGEDGMEIDPGDLQLDEGDINVNLGDVNVGGDVNVDSDVNVNGIVYAGAFEYSSDRNLKEKFTPINSQEILKRVVGLPVSRWDFKADDKVRHIGPMAQDFYAAFNVGNDNRHIAVVDEGGVALAAIQGLNQKLEADAKEKDAKIDGLEKRLAALEKLVESSANQQTGGAK